MISKPTITALSNGLTVVSSHSVDKFESTHFELTIRIGARDDDDRHFGLAHFVEHLVAKLIESKLRQHDWPGDYMLEGFDAFTDQEKTTYGIITAKEDFQKGLDLLLFALSSEALFEAITDDLVTAEKAIVQEELLSSQDEAVYLAGLQFAKHHYGQSSLSRGDVLGTTRTIGGFTVDEVQNHITRYYRPENAFLVIAGNFEHAAIYQLSDTLRNETKLPPFFY